jgi:hypothetical protein
MASEQHTDQPAVNRIICPGCDCVRAIDETPCPNCGRCLSCGREIARSKKRCECRFADNPIRVTKLVELFGVSDEQAEIAAQRFEIRKSREQRRLVSTLIVVGAWVIVSKVLGDYLNPQSFTAYAIYCLSMAAVLALCIYVLQRWDRGKERRMMREARKTPPGPNDETLRGDR